MNTLSLTGGFEGGGEFTAAIDLDDFDGAGKARAESGEEVRGGLVGRAGARLQNVPAGDDIARGEVPRITPGRGRRSKVSTSTRSPGCWT